MVSRSHTKIFMRSVSRPKWIHSLKLPIILNRLSSATWIFVIEDMGATFVLRKSIIRSSRWKYGSAPVYKISGSLCATDGIEPLLWHNCVIPLSQQEHITTLFWASLPWKWARHLFNKKDAGLLLVLPLSNYLLGRHGTSMCCSAESLTCLSVAIWCAELPECSAVVWLFGSATRSAFRGINLCTSGVRISKMAMTFVQRPYRSLQSCG